MGVCQGIVRQGKGRIVNELPRGVQIGRPCGHAHPSARKAPSRHRGRRVGWGTGPALGRIGPERVSADRRPAWRRGARAGRHTHLAQIKGSYFRFAFFFAAFFLVFFFAFFFAAMLHLPCSLGDTMGRRSQRPATHSVDTRSASDFQLKTKKRFGPCLHPKPYRLCRS